MSGFDDFLPDPPPDDGRIRSNYVSRENPYSLDGRDPYMALEPDEQFDMDDTFSFDVKRMRVEELAVVKGKVWAWGRHYLADGRSLSARRAQRIPVVPEQVPPQILERFWS